MALQEKKKVIETQMALVKKKMTRIKENAMQIQKQITEMLENTLNEMQIIVRKKTDQLKCDRHELVRQHTEILYVQEFIKKQSDEAPPLEFLQLSAGHSEIKYNLQKQWPVISGDLQDDRELMKLSGKPFINVSDNNQQLKNTQNTKLALQNVTGQGKGVIENFYKASKERGSKNYSSKFRESLFKQRSHLAEHALFNQNQSIKEQ